MLIQLTTHSTNPEFFWLLSMSRHNEVVSCDAERAVQHPVVGPVQHHTVTPRDADQLSKLHLH